jgi:predicted metal-dependent phosphoesterase TrpH
MRRFMADLHLHTALSPCASPDMTPPRIVAEALAQGLALIAVCDHNSCGNAAAVAGAAARAEAQAGGGRLAVIPGMEITTAEEVHVLGLFPDLQSARQAMAGVQAGLPAWAPPQGCTQQRLLDEEGRIVGYESHLLAGSSGLSLSQTVALIRELGGLAVASHVDRRSFSVVSQLGFLPPEVRFDALEISAAGAARGRAAEFLPAGLPLLCSSDGHSPEEVGAGCTALELEEPGFAELALALRGAGGRRCALA